MEAAKFYDQKSFGQWFIIRRTFIRVSPTEPVRLYCIARPHRLAVNAVLLLFVHPSLCRRIYMPNWISTRVAAAKHVLEAIINDHGEVDFERVVPTEIEWPWDSCLPRAENVANTVISAYGDFNRTSDDESFEQFVQMLRNYRKCESLHFRDFAITRWGTKWNANDSVVELDAGFVTFATAWNCPLSFLVALSKRFPDDKIDVVSDDEDLGFPSIPWDSNSEYNEYFGFHLLNGEIIKDGKILSHLSVCSSSSVVALRNDGTDALYLRCIPFTPRVRRDAIPFCRCGG